MSSQKYIVVFKPGVTSETISKHADDLQLNGGQITQRYESALNGFSATIPDSYLTSLNSLVGDVIDFIEPDGVVTTQ